MDKQRPQGFLDNESLQKVRGAHGTVCQGWSRMSISWLKKPQSKLGAHFERNPGCDSHPFRWWSGLKMPSALPATKTFAFSLFPNAAGKCLLRIPLPSKSSNTNCQNYGGMTYFSAPKKLRLWGGGEQKNKKVHEIHAKMAAKMPWNLWCKDVFFCLAGFPMRWDRNP